MQSANMTDSVTENNKSLLECSLLHHSCDNVSKSQPCLSPSMSSMPDWSLLPEEILHTISKNLNDEEDCFDVVHARSVCHTWRSSFPYPSCLLRQSYSLSALVDYQSKDFCILEKVPLFLLRIRASPGVPDATVTSPSMYYLGDLSRDKSEDHMELPSPLQCSVKVNIPGSDPTLMKVLDCQILSLGHQYKIIDCNLKNYSGMAFLPLNNEGGGGEFVVLLNYTRVLLVLRSVEMSWIRLQQISHASCSEVVAFRGKFYAVFLNRDVFVIDPYSLEATPLMPSQPLRSSNYLVPSGNDELFLVENFNPYLEADVLDFNRLTCRVSRLDIEAGEWIMVSDLGDRVFFIGDQGNCSCSAKELPDGCGVSGNSMLFINWPGNVIYFYKYGVQTEYAEDDLNFWRYSREYDVKVLNKSPPVVALRIE